MAITQPAAQQMANAIRALAMDVFGYHALTCSHLGGLGGETQ